MYAIFSRHLNLISLLLIPTLFTTTWLFPSIGITLRMILLLSGFAITNFIIVKKHKESYLQDSIPRNVFIRNLLLEFTAILLAMVLASILGKNAGEFVTNQFGHELARIIAGVLIGFLVGVVIGILIKQLSSHLVKT